MSKQIKLQRLEEQNIKEIEEPMNSDILLKEDISFDYAVNEGINLELSLVENFMDLSISTLEKSDVDLPTKDFGLGCCEITEIKDYIKEKEIKEDEEEYEELGIYNISNII